MADCNTRITKSQNIKGNPRILRLESQHILMSEAAIILKEFESKLIECRNEVFLPPNAQNSSLALHSKGLNIKMFKEKVENFYKTLISYLN